MKVFKFFLKVLCINVLCTCIPMLQISMLFGAPAALLSAITITLLFGEKATGG